MTFPSHLQINAWAGTGGNAAPLDPGLRSKILGLGIAARSAALPLPPPDPANWRDPAVGWGIVLPERAGLTAAELARADDAPQPIRDLVAARGDAPVFRYGPHWHPGTLRRYGADGSAMDLQVGVGNLGTGPGAVPLYLLICGSPAEIPWQVQFDLHHAHYTGRLDLDEQGLRHYVDALLADWDGLQPQAKHTLSWCVDHGGGDITTLMVNAVGQPIHQKFATDADAALVAGARFLTGDAATHAQLGAALAADRPALIVTTSHGATMPLDDPAAMRAVLGLPIDAGHQMPDMAAMTGAAAPSGAIWFAQACCSAGSAANSSFVGLVPDGSSVDQVLKAIAACGDHTAPLPRSLLGAARPLRAFVGHVEPTFDWSLRNHQTGQFMSCKLIDCFYQRLFTGQPIGMALAGVRNTAASFLSSYDLARNKLISAGDQTRLGPILALHLVARDWRSIVLLGDPTCRVPLGVAVG